MENPVVIVIPARYGSTRLPGKPLVKIGGTEMVKRVAAIADCVCRRETGCSYLVATDDDRIARFCDSNGIPVMPTSPDCGSGTERCWDAVRGLSRRPELIVNLQGDNPLCPPHVVQDLIAAWRQKAADVYTSCVHLSWDEYDRLRADKEETPYSGTTVIMDKFDMALAFSKSILPVIRNIAKAKELHARSPVFRHTGLYAYTYDSLKSYFSLEKSVYEEGYAEGLEQMRFLYNGKKIHMVKVDYGGRPTTSGVDSPEDIVRVEAIIEQYGELDLR